MAADSSRIQGGPDAWFVPGSGTKADWLELCRNLGNTTGEEAAHENEGIPLEALGTSISGYRTPYRGVYAGAEFIVLAFDHYGVDRNGKTCWLNPEHPVITTRTKSLCDKEFKSIDELVKGGAGDYVPKVYAAGSVQKAGRFGECHPAIAEEYVHAQTLTAGYFEGDMRQDLPAREAARIALSLFLAVGYIHNHTGGAPHGDIKPDNFMYARNSGGPGTDIVKIHGWGTIAKDQTDTDAHSAATFTPIYYAPERLDSAAEWLWKEEKAHRTDIQRDTKIDVYSLGIILAQLRIFWALGGKDRSFERAVLIERNQHGTKEPRPAFDLIANLKATGRSPESDDILLATIIRGCTEPHPSERWDMSQAIEELEAFLNSERSSAFFKQPHAAVNCEHAATNAKTTEHTHDTPLNAVVFKKPYAEVSCEHAETTTEAPGDMQNKPLYRALTIIGSQLIRAKNSAEERVRDARAKHSRVKAETERKRAEQERAAREAAEKAEAERQRAEQERAAREAAEKAEAERREAQKAQNKVDEARQKLKRKLISQAQNRKRLLGRMAAVAVLVLSVAFVGLFAIIRFDGNGATSGKMTLQIVPKGTEYTLPACDYQCEGHDFWGWEHGDSLYQEGESITIDGLTTLSAAWGHPVTFDGNGATNGTAFKEYSKSDGTLELPKGGFSRTGYQLAGWSESKGGDRIEKGATVTISKASTYYATWSACASFDGNGGSGSVSDECADANGEITLPENGFARPGWEFAGWSTSKDGYVISAKQKTNIGTPTTYFARWKPIANLNGNGSDSEKVDSVVAGLDGTLTLPDSNSLSRDGYKLLGWSTSSSGGDLISAGGTAKMDEPDTYYAIWGARIDFDANGATGGSTPSVYVNKDNNVDLPVCGFSYPDHTFIGWGVGRANTCSYNPGEPYHTSIPQKLYACWNLDPKVTNKIKTTAKEVEGTHGSTVFLFATNNSSSTLKISSHFRFMDKYNQELDSAQSVAQTVSAGGTALLWQSCDNSRYDHSTYEIAVEEPDRGHGALRGNIDVSETVVEEDKVRIRLHNKSSHPAYVDHVYIYCEGPDDAWMIDTNYPGTRIAANADYFIEFNSSPNQLPLNSYSSRSYYPDGYIDMSDDYEKPRDETAHEESVSNDYLLPDSNTRKYSNDELEKLSIYQLFIARNEIFARHGYTFGKEEAKDYFEKKSWYKPTLSPEDGEKIALNDAEKHNVEAMRRIERRRNSPYL